MERKHDAEDYPSHYYYHQLTDEWQLIARRPRLASPNQSAGNTFWGVKQGQLNLQLGICLLHVQGPITSAALAPSHAGLLPSPASGCRSASTCSTAASEGKSKTSQPERSLDVRFFAFCFSSWPFFPFATPRDSSSLKGLGPADSLSANPLTSRKTAVLERICASASGLLEPYPDRRHLLVCNTQHQNLNPFESTYETLKARSTLHHCDRASQFTY